MQVAVIMAGGSGERFWPVSRRDHPKQLLRLTSADASMLEEAVSRIATLIPVENVYVVTGRHLVAPIREASTGLLPENIIAEPCKRNTAGCLVYAVAFLLARTGLAPGEISMAVLTADQRIPDREPFVNTVRAALLAAEKEAALVTVGISPVRPETGFGYIELPPNAEPLPGLDSRVPVYPVVRFTEKPDEARATEYVESGRYLWNSGMFFWRISTFLDEFRRCDPRFADAGARIAERLACGDAAGADAAFEALPGISIDYALMEAARRVLVVPGRFAWDDVGSWDALDRSLPRDSSGNVSFGDPIVQDCEDCIVYNEPGAAPMALAAIGLRGLVVVVTKDGVLVVPKDRAQDVKKAVEALRERGSSQL